MGAQARQPVLDARASCTSTRRTRRTVLVLDQEMPPIAAKTTREYVRHIRIRSERLSKFWGRDMYLGAHVLVPEGFDAHPQARYPLMVFHGHFPDDISGFRTEPPDPNLKPDYSERFHLAGYNRIEQQEAYDFYQKWIGADFPRFLVVEIQHANPYYDDSYAVNSANLGPYGDAINKELIPEIERRSAASGRAGRASRTAARRAAGRRSRRRCSIPTCTTVPSPPAPTRSTSAPTRSINLYEDRNAYTLQGEAPNSGAPGNPQLPGRGVRDPARRELHGLALATTAAPGGSTTSGRPCSRRWARMVTRSRSSTR